MYINESCPENVYLFFFFSDEAAPDDVNTGRNRVDYYSANAERIVSSSW